MKELHHPTSPTPAALGYRMPAEWHPHESTWLAWPKNESTWPGLIPRVQQTYLEILIQLGELERVNLLVDNADEEYLIRRQLETTDIITDQVFFHHIPTVDSWIRDYGPNFILRLSQAGTQLAFNHWQFNSWGNKYPELQGDGVIPEQLENILGIPRFTPPQVLEGGAIDVNGDGICLVTEQCLLNPNRNPDSSKAQSEQFLKDYLGVAQILWLHSGICGDDTDGHVDNIARFVDPQTIVCPVEEDTYDENYQPLQENYRRLMKARNLKGEAFKIVTLPMPGRLEGPDGRFPASYANFYIANSVVLAPIFHHSNDRRALETLCELFPDRKVVGLDCTALVKGMGGPHCVTQQQPSQGLCGSGVG